MSSKNLTTMENAIAVKLKKLGGRGTADQLLYNYVQIEPLIRRKYVTVQNDNGTPVYVLTPDGYAYSLTLPG